MNENLHVTDVISFKVFDEDTCQRIIGKHRDKEWTRTQIGRHAQIVSDRAVRSSSIIDLSRDEEFIDLFMGDMAIAIREANSQFWKFDITESLEMQIMKYTPGDHYKSWHLDVGNTARTACRKVTFIIQLSDPSEYSGGDLNITGMKRDSQTRLQGSAIMFPSFVSHNVGEVTSGTRYCLVGWVHGPSFR